MIFVDTSALVALADAGDDGHARAVAYLESVRPTPRTFVTTNYVLDEAFTVLRRAIGLAHTVAFADALLTSSLYTIVQVDLRVQELAWEWFKRRDDADFSFTDCTSFVVMASLSLHEAFTFDRHFAQAGFVCVPGPSSHSSPK